MILDVVIAVLVEPFAGLFSGVVGGTVAMVDYPFREERGRAGSG